MAEFCCVPVIKDRLHDAVRWERLRHAMEVAADQMVDSVAKIGLSSDALSIIRNRLQALSELACNDGTSDWNNDEAYEMLKAADGCEDLARVFDMTVDAVRSKAETLVQSIQENFTLLGLILDRHETTIGKHWQKKSEKLRLGIILEAWGSEIAKHHRPDMEASNQKTAL